MHPECVDEELINILAELCIMTKTYQQVYDVGLSVVIPFSLNLSLSVNVFLLHMYGYAGHHKFLQHAVYHTSNHLR